MDTIQTVFISAIDAAINDVMKGIYIAGFMFVLGLIPAVAMRCVTVAVDEI